MKLKLDCVFAETDAYGTVKMEVNGTEELAGMLDGMDVAGFHFEARAEGSGAVVFVEGDGLSDKVTPNYAGKVGTAVFQIGFKKEPGRKTASILNVFLRKAAKVLEKSGTGCNALLVKGVEALA